MLLSGISSVTASTVRGLAAGEIARLFVGGYIYVAGEEAGVADMGSAGKQAAD